MQLVDGHLAWYGFTHIQLHAASYSCYLHVYGQLLNVRCVSYVRLLHWQHHGGLTGVCGAAVSQRVVDWMKRRSVSSIQIRSNLAQVFLQP